MPTDGNFRSMLDIPKIIEVKRGGVKGSKVKRKSKKKARRNNR